MRDSGADIVWRPASFSIPNNAESVLGRTLGMSSSISQDTGTGFVALTCFFAPIPPDKRGVDSDDLCKLEYCSGLDLGND